MFNKSYYIVESDSVYQLNKSVAMKGTTFTVFVASKCRWKDFDFGLSSNNKFDFELSFVNYVQLDRFNGYTFQSINRELYATNEGRIVLLNVDFKEKYMSINVLVNNSGLTVILYRNNGPLSMKLDMPNNRTGMLISKDLFSLLGHK